MLKIVTIIGARPQFIKAAAISRVLKEHYQDTIKEVIVHTGQHYDQNMSSIFFEELEIPKPHHKLTDVSIQEENPLSRMTEELRAILKTESPNTVIVYGDTLSTLAGAEATASLNIPLIHIEAGLRSFNNNMPEEFNRVKTDQLASLLFVPTQEGIENLSKEGITQEKTGQIVFLSGDIMYDNSIQFADKANRNSTILLDLSIEEKFLLATVHRNTNTDNPERLAEIFTGLRELAELGFTIVLPLHPRTRKMMKTLPKDLLEKIERTENLKLVDPVSFLDMIALESSCDAVITDSGGVQKEAFFFKKPCVLLREETEWVELVENGNAVLAGADAKKIVQATQELLEKDNFTFPDYYGNGKAAKLICDQIVQNVKC